MIDFPVLAAQCAPQVPVATLRAIVRHESGFDALAIGINARPDRRARLSRKPEMVREAIEAAQALLARGYRVDLGLAQVSSQWLGRRGFKADGSALDLADLFEPCRNLSVGAAILVGCRQRASSLQEALSCYNTGDMRRGLSNGYVSAIYRAARHAG